MFVSSRSRHHERETTVLTPQELRRTYNEELSVPDVFAPQTPEHEENLENNGTDKWIGRDKDAGLRNMPVGFHMKTPETSPTRDGYRTGNAEKHGLGNKQTGSSEKAKRRKNKKKADAASSGGRANIDNKASKALPPILTPLAGAGKNSGIQSSGGVSALKQQLEALDLSSQRPESSSETSKFGSQTPSNASAASDSDHTEILTSYEVPLEHDFVSSDAEIGVPDGVQTTSIKDLLHRKMTADDFEPITCLGKGSFGTVLLVRHKSTGILYAQKQFTKASLTVHKRLVEQTKTERTILESVNRHPFVVKLFYAFQDHEKLYLILEYAQGGELFTHLAMERMFKEDAAAFYMAQMVLALEHLHCNVGVIYRDLKPENCLLDSDGHLVLTDFGLSKVAVGGEDRCNSSLGTIDYMAPEVIQGKSYGKACDWWSLGALGFDLLTGSPPFKGNNHAKITEKILKQKLMLPYFLGPDSKDLLIRLLRKDPAKRLGYHIQKDIKTIKGHRFFRNIDWKALERREIEPPILPVVTDPALAENFSADFTSLSLSPMVSTMNPPLFSDGRLDSRGVACCGPASEFQDDPFGGFSFVASSSLIESEFCCGDRNQ